MWYRLHHMIGFVMCTQDTGIKPSATSQATRTARFTTPIWAGAGDPECETAGNGARACIVGKFVELPYAGFGGATNRRYS